MKTAPAVILAFLALSAGSAGAHERIYRAEYQPGWVHRDIARFHERDVAVWRSGYWHHGRYHGRLGWWWVVGGAWYFYPARVLPYPDPYLPPAMVTPALPLQAHWYYCPRPAGYYPYVPRCRVSWQAVPAVR